MPRACSSRSSMSTLDSPCAPITDDLCRASPAAAMRGDTDVSGEPRQPSAHVDDDIDPVRRANTAVANKIRSKIDGLSSAVVTCSKPRLLEGDALFDDVLSPLRAFLKDLGDDDGVPRPADATTNSLRQALEEVWTGGAVTEDPFLGRSATTIGGLGCLRLAAEQDLPAAITDQCISDRVVAPLQVFLSYLHLASILACNTDDVLAMDLFAVIIDGVMSGQEQFVQHLCLNLLRGLKIQFDLFGKADRPRAVQDVTYKKVHGPKDRPVIPLLLDDGLRAPLPIGCITCSATSSWCASAGETAVICQRCRGLKGRCDLPDQVSYLAFFLLRTIPYNLLQGLYRLPSAQGSLAFGPMCCRIASPGG